VRNTEMWYTAHELVLVTDLVLCTVVVFFLLMNENHCHVCLSDHVCVHSSMIQFS